MPLLLCPNCETGMQAVNRNDVQIDICSNCRGVWLDRGELEKLLSAFKDDDAETYKEREGSFSAGNRNPESQYQDNAAIQRQQQERYQDEDRKERYDIPMDRREVYINQQQPERRYSSAKAYRKKSAFERLSELFD